MEDDNPLLLRYEDPDPEQVATPEPALYGAPDDARRQIRSLRGFADAVLHATQR